MPTSEHQSSITAMGRRYGLNIFWPQEKQSHGTSSTTPSPQGGHLPLLTSFGCSGKGQKSFQYL